MPSRFAAAICAHVVRRQGELGVAGPIAEIGAFEGRFLIALALALSEGEEAFGLDRLDWPDDGVEARFLANCRDNGLPPGRVRAVKRDSRQLSPEALGRLLGERPVR